VIPVWIAVARRPVAIGLTVGLATFIVAETFARLLLAYGKVGGVDLQVRAIGGTWAFVAFGFLLLGVLAIRLFALPEGRAPSRAESAPARRAAT
jgi:hypothetical protein